ncbi:hypothetical protein BGZ63DRAFT_401690 [Mariannaea sp. PMI_226]|nr:hypothetical protein BGZ63DRAFT_401690 [Mariannaea sp. PMI_226]
MQIHRANPLHQLRNYTSDPSFKVNSTVKSNFGVAGGPEPGLDSFSSRRTRHTASERRPQRFLVNPNTVPRGRVELPNSHLVGCPNSAYEVRGLARDCFDPVGDCRKYTLRHDARRDGADSRSVHEVKTTSQDRVPSNELFDICQSENNQANGEQALNVDNTTI